MSRHPARARFPVSEALACTLTLALIAPPAAGARGLAPEAQAEEAGAEETDEASTAEAEAEPEPEQETEQEPEQEQEQETEPEQEQEPEPEPEQEQEPEPEQEPDAAAESESDSDGDDEVPTSTVPERLPKMQVAAWWTLFGAFALASTAGVFSGLAERQEDKAVRLASRFDQDTGSQPQFSDTQSEYNDIVDRGRAYQSTAIALGAVAGAVVIVAAALFIVDARRGRTSKRARVAPTGFQVRF